MISHLTLSTFRPSIDELVSYRSRRRDMSFLISSAYRSCGDVAPLQRRYTFNSLSALREGFIKIDLQLISLMDKLQHLEVRGQLSDLESESLTIILSILFEGEYDLYPDKRDELHRLQKELEDLSSFSMKGKSGTSVYRSLVKRKKKLVEVASKLNEVNGIYVLLQPINLTSYQASVDLQLSRVLLKTLSRYGSGLPLYAIELRERLSFYLATSPTVVKRNLKLHNILNACSMQINSCSLITSVRNAGGVVSPSDERVVDDQLLLVRIIGEVMSTV